MTLVIKMNSQEVIEITYKPMFYTLKDSCYAVFTMLKQLPLLLLFQLSEVNTNTDELAYEGLVVVVNKWNNLRALQYYLD
jgi:hypothetical protein